MNEQQEREAVDTSLPLRHLNEKQQALKANLKSRVEGRPKMAEILAQIVEESSTSHRILREITPERVLEAIALRRAARGISPDQPASPVRKGMYLDFETTGFDSQNDQVIEIACLVFSCDRHGILPVPFETYQGFRDPGIPIPEEITRITGITDEMVKGQQIDFGRLEAMAGECSFFVAHNAGFDRPFAERLEDNTLAERFRNHGWLCSSSQIDWSLRGMMSSKLQAIALQTGWFYGAHRADNDVLAGIAVLTEPPQPDRPQDTLAARHDTFSEMLRKGSETVYRIWAKDSPFETKDDLKARGYAWDGEAKAGFRSWWKDCFSEEEQMQEKYWLAHEVYPKRGGTIGISEITPRDRFSVRCHGPQRELQLTRADIARALEDMRQKEKAPELQL